MREIKFKAYNKEDEKIYNVENIFFIDNSVMLFNNYKSFEKDIKEIKLLQYTGLKDKNGIEIYEGDILKSNRVGEVGVVEWNGKYFMYIVKTKEQKYTLEYFKEKVEFEVIGNIYENKELLKDFK